MTTQITQLPPAPQHTDSPAVFSTKGDNFIAALPQFVTETNQLAVDLNTAMNSAYLGNTATSTTSVAIGTGTKNFTVETNKNFVKGMTLKITFDSANYIIGEITSYTPSTGALVVSVLATLGSGTYAAWSISPTVYYTPILLDQSFNSNITLFSTQSGTMYSMSGATTVTLSAAATLKNGWYVYIKNVGVDNVTIQANGAETINGTNTAVVKSGSFVLITCNGVSFTYIPIVDTNTPDRGYKNKALITATGTFDLPVGTTRCRAYVVGQGASGHATNGSGGGGGLAWGDFIITSSTRQLSITINSSVSNLTYNGQTHLAANAASGTTGGTAAINPSLVFNGGTSTGGAGGGVGGASSGTIFGTGVAGSATAGAGGSGWGGNGSGLGGGGIGSASGGGFSGGTGANQGGRGILDPFTDPLILTFNEMGQPPITGTSPYYSPDGVGGCSASNGASGNPATAGNGGFGAGGGGSNVSVGAGISTAGNGGFGGGGGGAIAQTGGIAQAGAGGYGGGGGKASGGSTNNQGAGGAGAVIILY